MPSRTSFSVRERELRSRLHALINRAEDFLHGSPVEMTRRCGNPNCRCAANDEHKHRSLCLGQTRKGKTSTIYIPRCLESKVRQGIDNFKQAQELLEELNVEARKRLENEKAAAKQSPARKAPVKRKSARKKSLPEKEPS